jgi:hypothetical protein
MSAPIPWYFMWSEKYRFFYEIMKDTANQPEFELKPIQIQQSQFDDELYTVPTEHFWYGSMIKVDMVINSLLEAAATGAPYILFSDIDLVIKPGVNQALQPYLENEMVFLNETDSKAGIEFMLLRPTDSVIGFWKMVRNIMVGQKGLDQDHVNDLLPSFGGKYAKFDQEIFTSTNAWNGRIPFVVMQLQCSRIGKDDGLEKQFNMAERLFIAAQHIPMEPYMQYVTTETISFLYTFQEIYIRSHESASNS